MTPDSPGDSRQEDVSGTQGFLLQQWQDGVKRTDTNFRTVRGSLGKGYEENSDRRRLSAFPVETEEGSCSGSGCLQAASSASSWSNSCFKLGLFDMSGSRMWGDHQALGYYRKSGLWYLSGWDSCLWLQNKIEVRFLVHIHWRVFLISTMLSMFWEQARVSCPQACPLGELMRRSVSLQHTVLSVCLAKWFGLNLAFSSCLIKV